MRGACMDRVSEAASGGRCDARSPDDTDDYSRVSDLYYFIHLPNLAPQSNKVATDVTNNTGEPSWLISYPKNEAPRRASTSDPNMARQITIATPL